MNRNDGAVGDARKRAASSDEWHDVRCEREYTDNGFIFIDCLCGLRKAKADAWDEGVRTRRKYREDLDVSHLNPYRAEVTR